MGVFNLRDQVVHDYAEYVRSLRKHQAMNDASDNITLLYLYWEPTNADEISVCQAHREKITSLKKAVAESKITFHAMSYSQLWNQWQLVPELTNHVANLQSRYEVDIELEGMNG